MSDTRTAKREHYERSTNKMRLYISGPMTGLPEFNFPEFDRMAEFLRMAGIEPISPADHDRRVLAASFAEGNTPYNVVENVPGYADGDVELYTEHTGAVHDLLVWDIAQIVAADGIVLLPGWENSTGAAHERYVAEATHKRIFLGAVDEFGRISMSADEQPERLTARPKYAQRVEDAELAELGHRWVDENVDRITHPVEGDFDTLERAAEYVDHVHAGVQEVRVIDPNTGGAKGAKAQAMDLLPYDVLLDVSEHYHRGAQKYAARNWELGYAWSLSFAALQRHLLAWWNGENDDPEFGASHLRGVLFHAMALRAYELRGIGTDDRPSLRRAVA